MSSILEMSEEISAHRLKSGANILESLWESRERQILWLYASLAESNEGNLMEPFMSRVNQKYLQNLLTINFIKNYFRLKTVLKIK